MYCAITLNEINVFNGLLFIGYSLFITGYVFEYTSHARLNGVKNYLLILVSPIAFTLIFTPPNTVKITLFCIIVIVNLSFLYCVVITDIYYLSRYGSCSDLVINLLYNCLLFAATIIPLSIFTGIKCV